MTHKIIKKFGGSFVVIITKDERRMFNLDEGDIVDVAFNRRINYDAMKRIAEKKNEGRSSDTA